MKRFILNLLLELIISLILFFVIALLMSFTSISENVLTPLIVAVSMFAIFVGSFCYAKDKRKHGIIHGGLLGIFYILLLYIISSVMYSNFNISANSLFMIILSILGGIIGGVLGVNF